MLACVISLFCAGCARAPDHSDAPQELMIRVTGPTDVEFRPVSEPTGEQRWRDIADAPYAPEFIRRFSYDDSAAVRVALQPRARRLTGVISAKGLKPWMAYQLKLVGTARVLGVDEAANATGTRAWSSWQLGTLGRWWCADCGWNVSDADLATHLAEGHDVRGYMLFDWLVTDAAGNARHEFACDASLHVLWKVGQRERGPSDSAPRWYDVKRDREVYGEGVAAHDRVGIFAEWEPERPAIGAVQLPPGRYSALLNLTEETFHANMDEDRTLDGGGFWPWVLEAPVEFEVSAPASRVSCPGCLPGPHQGVRPLWRRGKSGSA